MEASARYRRAEIVVDLGAIRRNVETLRERVEVPVMVVVKADGYGHGMLAAARAARAGGATWLGVADRDEALALRDAGDTGRILAWLGMPGEDPTPLLAADVDVAAYSVAELTAIATAARALGSPARVHLKVDTGLSRGGAPVADWDALVAAARSAELAGEVVVAGVWSHFACSDEPAHPANDAQESVFRDALEVAEREGLAPEVRHLANSAAALLRPSSRFDLVRFGLAAYGLSPAPEEASAADLGLVPAMTVRARVVLGKDLDAGAGISYGHTYVTERPVHVALVPLGYGDGIPRHASSAAQVLVGGVRGDVLGRICMDQFVVEAPAGVAAGDEVVLFGPGADGEPTAQEWAERCGTISYEIVTRIGGNAGRAARRWVEG
ncbi:alanine racemase [Marmoricola sp. RAF53]|uniref:alanine racemase n=1 Tax=Marmoricola sp. RAF53 TaxID=3233059 RepID=UPI003F9E0DB7